MIVDINSQWQTVQIQISWLLQKPTDLDLQCLQNRVYPGSEQILIFLTLVLLNRSAGQGLKGLISADKMTILC